MEENLKRFVGEHVIITGAGSGIGRGIAHRFASEGAQVTGADVDQEGGKKVVEEIKAQGGTAQFIPVDVAKETSIQELIKKATDAYGPIKVGVSNAGISETQSSCLEISGAEWDRIYGVNVRGSFMFCRACGNNMMDNDVKGSIITISSTMGRTSKNMTGAYASSKSAVIMFTKSLAKALVSMGIRVNSVAPGMVATNLYRPVEGEMMMEKDSFVPWIIEQCITSGQLLIPRVGTPEDMAAAVTFLASKDAAYITAQCISVDGGMDWSW
ncbi:MAG: SDR family NAD(P)-dependent oxidoreductase [Proteobacteria bacterium]|nr:SDR family NAD(P)-dependent oxidoreductase [Pseudomonadota bacterium]